ncbi:MAG TPA: hypothetical protein VLE89_01240 [Chlamydiales bacterium]|nr:hypothetical protein [Chlamydiales bacterium]
MKKVAIYLAGSIQKGHETHESYWTAAHMEILKKELKNVIFLNPAFRTDNLSDQLSVFGRDMLQVFCSHVVFVDARDRRGLGVGAEMMWAKVNRIPVVTWAPKETHYHKSKTTILNVPVENFIHPFVESLSDAIVETVADGAAWIQKWMADPSMKIKGIDHVALAMEHYKESQLIHDLPMKELFQMNEELQKRMQRPLSRNI